MPHEHHQTNTERVLQLILHNLKHHHDLIHHVIDKQEKIMADLTGLNTAVTDLQAGVAASTSHMDKLFADLLAALAAGGNTDQAAVDAAVAAIRTEIDNLAAAVTRDTQVTG